jgi:hypothetical protein
MAKYNKESLEKLLVLVKEITQDKENFWFKEDLSKILNLNLNIQNKYNTDDSINHIYEYCIKDIIAKQANKFYEDFIIDDIKNVLISDFIRMDHFRRDDNFEDFCLAMFQQLESIVIYLYDYFELEKKIIANYDQRVISIYSKEEKKIIRKNNGIYLSNFIFQKYKLENPFELYKQEFFFNNKIRAVLYYFYFNETIEYNSNKFDEIFNMANNLYQIRNLNHRGGGKNEYQQKLIDEIMPNHNKYYFKFLGFLESFVSVINNNLKPMH